jgi:hypothetical protein
MLVDGRPACARTAPIGPRETPTAPPPGKAPLTSPAKAIVRPTGRVGQHRPAPLWRRSRQAPLLPTELAQTLLMRPSTETTREEIAS